MKRILFSLTTVIVSLFIIAPSCNTEPSDPTPPTPQPEPEPEPGVKNDTVLRVQLKAIASLDVRKTENAYLVWDVMHALSTMQGIVNRDEPKMYIRYISSADDYWWNLYNGGDGGTWIKRMKTRDVAVKDVASAASVVDFYKKQGYIKGLVAYDSNVYSTSNLASSIAGADDLIAVRYDTTSTSMYSALTGLGLKVKVWLVNEDGTSKFTSKTDPYLWLIDNYINTGKLSPEYAGYYVDQYWIEHPTSVWDHHQLSNHDYFVSKKAVFFDLSPWADEAPTDNPGASIDSDFQTMGLIMNSMRERLPSDKMIKIGGFPLWQIKYTDYAEGRHGAVATEWEFVRVVSQYRAYIEADALGGGSMANASFWQHFPLNSSYPKQDWVTEDSLKEKGYLTEEGKVNTDNIYVFFYIGDYDSPAWLYRYIPGFWKDSARGKLPLAWAISAVLSDRAPMVMHYMRKRAKDGEYFMGADNGAGYLTPGSLPKVDLPVWASHNKKYYDLWGYDLTGFVIPGNDVTFTDEMKECYYTFSPKGITLYNYDKMELYKDEMPVLPVIHGIDGISDQDLIDLIQDPEQRGYPFVWLRSVLQTPSKYLHWKEVIESCDTGKPMIYMDAPSFFELAKIYMQQAK